MQNTKFKIDCCSKELPNGKYKPIVSFGFTETKGYKTTGRTLKWSKEFDTKKEADEYAMRQAKIYINQNF